MASIGKPIDRVDGHLKVTGRATYAAEFALSGLVHAVLVQSTIAAGKITGFDLAAAQSMPGVLLIITPDNALRLPTGKGGSQPVKGPLLQDHDVVFNGQHVAVVVADTLDRALAAAARVKVQYRRDEAVTDMDAVLAQAYVPKSFRNGARPADSRRGDPDTAYQAAFAKLDATYVTPIEHHNPMEPHATIARWEGDRLTVWTATQGISTAQRTLAGHFGIDPAQVRVICPFVGGGFGCKGNTWPPVTLAAMAAKMTGRPVKLVLTRAQMFTSNGYRPRTVQKIRAAAETDGALQSLRHDGFNLTSQAMLGEFSEPVALASEFLYACPNVAVSHKVVATNMSLPTYMRAPGEASGMFALESAIDELAATVRMDPLAFRMRNYAENDAHEGKPYASKALMACYTQGARAFGWEGRAAGTRATRDGNVLVGWGMATATYPTNRQSAAARVRIGADGSVLVQSGTQDLGTGTYTVMSQVAADALGVPVSRIRFELGDSALPHAPVSGGSSTVPSVAPAVAAACAAAAGKLRDMARADPQLGWGDVDASSLQVQDGAVIGPDRRIGIAALLARHGQSSVEAVAESGPGDEKKRFSLHAFGAHFVEVRVDAELGEIRVARYVGAFDIGRTLNAKTARSQLIGGITYGIGMALLEETHVDGETGRIVNANIAEYLVPVHADVPAIETILVENQESRSNPLGVKGAGELPMVGVAAAIANAVYHATGVRVRKVPIRIEDVLGSA